MMDVADITHRFAFHAAPNQEKRNDHASVRIACARLAHELNKRLPDGREKVIVMARLEEAMFWANAALARDTGDSDA